MLSVVYADSHLRLVSNFLFAMLSVVMLNVVMLNVVMLSVVAPYCGGREHIYHKSIPCEHLLLLRRPHTYRKI